MGKFDGILLASDFDQTISDLKGTIPPSNLQALDYFTAEGGRFCLNTGRSIAMARNREQWQKLSMITGLHSLISQMQLVSPTDLPAV